MDKIRVGLSATLSGKYSLQGIESFNGILLWAEHTNRSGGIVLKNQSKQVPVELIHYDDQSNPKNTGQITRKLILEDNVDILLGPYSSNLNIAAAKISEYYNRVLWNYGGSSDEILHSGFKKIVSTITPASRYFEPFLNLILKKEKNAGPVAIVFAEDSGFSTEVAKGAMSKCEEYGIEFKKYRYPSGTEDFSETVKQISSAQIRYVLGVGRFEDDVNLAKHLTNFYSCLVAASIEEFKNILQKDSDGFFSVAQWEADAEYNIDFGITSKYFTDLYQKKFNKIPDYTSAQAFNMGIILGHFIEQTGTVNEEFLMSKIINSDFYTFYGNFKIDKESGLQTGHKTIVIQWQNGKKEIIFPIEQQTSQIILF
ncbi:MAG: amino acid ABC transporter substrate-binding protein [Thermodesulfobacteriota bacterium]